MRRPTRAAATSLAVLTILLAACATGGASPSPSGSPGSGGGGGGIIHPAGADLVVRLGYEGGFVPVEFVFSSLPAITISGDGTVVMPGAQIDIFPGPALPAVQARKLTEAGLQLVLDELARSGFFAESADFNGAQAMVADASTSVFTMHADEREVTVKIYALGAVTDDAQLPATMGARERQAHKVLAPLAEKLTSMDAWIPASAWAEREWHPYQPAGLRLLVRNADGDPADPSGINGGEIAWPVSGDPATFGDPYPVIDGARCGVVTGDEAEAWWDALGAANQLTRFTKGEHRYQVTPRPIVPGDEPGCPGAASA